MTNAHPVLAGAMSLAFATSALAGTSTADKTDDHLATHDQPVSAATTTEVMNRATNPAVDIKGVLSDMSADDLDDLEGAPLYGDGGELLGDVDDVKVDPNTREPVFVIGIDGVLGDNAKEVVVTMGEVQLDAERDALWTELSHSDLTSRVDIDPLDGLYEDLDDDLDDDDGAK